MKWASLVSEEPDLERAVRALIPELQARTAGAVPDLLIAFVSQHHRAGYELLPKRLGEAFPDALLLGCSGRSVIGAGREIEGSPGLALCAAVLPGVSLHPFHLSSEEILDPDAGREGWCERLGLSANAKPSFILLADAFASNVERLLLGLDTTFPDSVTIGGLASGGTQPGENALYLGREVHREGLVSVAASGNVRVDTIVAQGCRPLGNPMFVTRCDGNLLLEVDGRRPVEVLHELYAQASPSEQELFRTSLFVGIEMSAAQSEYRQGDFLIRNLVGADSESGTLVVAAALRETQVVQFHLRDAQTAADDLEHQLARYPGEGPPPRGALLFSCLGRGRELYDEPDHDSNAFHRRLGDVPLTGFFCNGEIGPVQRRTFLHGYTSAFGLFRPISVPAPTPQGRRPA